jgi:sulfur dioxygenase
MGARQTAAVSRVSVAWVRDAVSKGNQAPFLVDVRGLDEWVSPLGHVKGSVLLPLPEINSVKIESFAKTVGENRPLVVVCKSGGRATAAGEQFSASGKFSSVAVMDGGMLAWNSAGFEVDRAPPGPGERA